MTEVDQQAPAAAMPVETGPPAAEAPPIPEYLLEAAGTAIGHVLETSDRRTIPINRLVAAAFQDEKIGGDEFTAFRQALNEDERLIHSGGGRYAIAGRIDASSVREVEAAAAEDERHHLTLLADHLALRLSALEAKGVNVNVILGMANTGIGGRLTAQEAHDVLGLLAVHPGVDPLENGCFAFKPDASFEPQAEDFFRSPLGSVDASAKANDTSANSRLSRKQLASTLEDLRSHPRTRQARADRHRLATPKRRPAMQKGNKRSQGAYHGKKKRLDGTVLPQPV